MITVLYTAFVVLALFGLTIFVHELGHFLVARWAGMVVETFSIGFGPAIWRRKYGDVTYKIGVIPFGGYVALPQMDPSDRKEEEKLPLPRVAPGRRVAVALAGAAGNMILAVILAYLVYWIGKPSSPRETSCVIGFVETNSVAYAAGIRIGDEIVGINGEPVGNWDELETRAALADEAVLRVRSSEDPGLREVSVPLEHTPFGIKMLEGLSPVNFCDVGSVFSGSGAEAAGIKPGDRIVEFDGRRLWSREHLILLVNAAADRETPMVVLRGGQRLDLRVTPRYDEKVGRALIGVGFSMMDLDYSAITHPGPWSQIRGHASGIFRFLRALVTPKKARAAAQGVGGPIAIFVLFWMAVRNSVMVAVWFAGFINVNLAVINLVPIPPFDGGHVVFALWEMITRKPIQPRVFNAVMNTLFILVFALLIFLSYRDVTRLIWPRWAGENSRPPAAGHSVPLPETNHVSVPAP
jgi:regulator of sigma E protease